MEDFDKHWESTLVNINGEYVPGKKAKVSILDWSFIYGYGVFEGVSVAQGKILNLEPHIKRLYNSAKRIGIDLPITQNKMAMRWVETARKNEMEDGYLRPIVSRGEGPLGIHQESVVDEPTIVVIPQLHRTGSLETIETLSARVTSVRASSPLTNDPRVKANQYLPNILAVKELEGTDSDTPIILTDDGYVTEAGAANIFIVTDDELYTPPNHHILEGTTRGTLIDVVEDEELLPVETKELTLYDIYTADECFVTGSLSGIKAITEINKTTVGNGDVGATTETLNAALQERLLMDGISIENKDVSIT